MKKCTFLFLFALNTSLAALANNREQTPQQKEPEKKIESKQTKLLSKGYFTIFELLLDTPEPQDTTLKKVQVIEKSA
jgi:hypothetical protein